MTSLVFLKDIMVRKGLFWTIGEQLYSLYYPVISCQRIRVYRVETMDMGRSRWNIGVSTKTLIEKCCHWKIKSYKILRYFLSG